MTNPTPLSQAAKAVLDAFLKSPMGQSHVDDDLIAIAAALRAAAEEILYKEQLGWTGYGYYTDFQNQIRAIADELEAQ